MAQVSTYSFKQVQATFTGPSADPATPLSFSITEGGVGEEGITIEAFEDKNVMLTGADGSVQHSLRVAQPGTITIRVMRNNILNVRLMNAYNTQTSSAKLHGFNVILITDSTSGESYTATNVAFRRLPENSWGKDASIIEWVLDAGNILPIAGENTGGQGV